MYAPPAEFSFVRRECRAVRIPEGTPAILSSGTRIRITQSLGNSFTIATERGYLFRVEARDADALGKVPGEALAELAEATLEDRVWAHLRKCYDPEIPINIVDLGLIYSCEILDDGRRVEIKMTLTAPGCGMGPVLAQDVQKGIESFPEVETANIEVVFDPPWDQKMMSEAARLELGLF